VSLPPCPALEIRELSVRFGGLAALSSVSLSVPGSAIAGLIGPNGAGKTTLFNCVSGAVSPASGRVVVFGEDVTDWPSYRRARLGVGRTFQRLELFRSLSVLENLVVAVEAHLRRGGLFADLLALPASVETRQQAVEKATGVLELVGLEEQRDVAAGALPLGLARLAELGRALCTEPRLLLLDEPSSGLRGEESRRLAQLIRRLSTEQGVTVLVVEHDMDFVLGLCEQVTVLDIGRVLAEGPPRRIRADPAVQAAYLGAPDPEHPEHEERADDGRRGRRRAGGGNRAGAPRG
jgi:ABC-type branched-subunit amino acid transport system ATPase component